MQLRLCCRPAVRNILATLGSQSVAFCTIANAPLHALSFFVRVVRQVPAGLFLSLFLLLLGP
jgi:hypothetical protein